MHRLLPVLALLLAGCYSPFVADDDDTGLSGVDDDDTTGDDDDTTSGDDDDSSPADDDDSAGDDDDSTPGDDDDTTPGDDDDSVGDDDDTVGDDDDSTGTQLAYIYAHTSTALYTVDPTTFAVTWVGDFTGANWLSPDITDIAIDVLGNMYAVGFGDLYTVNPLTAQLTHLGTYFDLYGNVNAATCLPDGTLILGGGANLFESSTTSATRTLLGSVGGDWLFAGDTVGLPDGLLYNLMAEDDVNNPTSLLTVDPDANLALSVVGATGTGAMFGLAYHSANGLVYGFTEAGDIYTIDPLTGAATLEASTGIAFWGATTNPARWQ